MRLCRTICLLKRKKTRTCILAFIIGVAALIYLTVLTIQPHIQSPFYPVTCPKCALNSSEKDKLDPRLWIPDEPFVYYKPVNSLGNQMFHYACAYTAAKINKLPLLVYVDSEPGSELPGFKLSHGEFALHLFNVPLPHYDTSRVKLISDYIEEARNHSRMKESEDVTIVSQDYKVTNTILQLGGFCQSEWFFYPYRDEIRKLFRLKNPNTPSIIKWKNVIKGLNQSYDSVCVHVRQGDFIHIRNRLVNTTFYITSMDEMRDRLQEIRRSPVFFLFSDDIPKVKKDFKRMLSIESFNQLRWVSDPEMSLVEDLYLMSQCRHNIISTSSFGWWGAYLNDYPEKIVIAAHYKPEFFKGNPLNVYLNRFFYYPRGWYIKDFPYIN